VETMREWLPKYRSAPMLGATYFNEMARFAELATKADIILCDMHDANVMRDAQHKWKIVDFEFCRNVPVQDRPRYRNGATPWMHIGIPKGRLTHAELRERNMGNNGSEYMDHIRDGKLDTAKLTMAGREMYRAACKDSFLAATR